jgi:hypothetical protein
MSEKPVIDSVAAKVISLAGETKFAPNGIVSRTLLLTLTKPELPAPASTFNLEKS